MKKKVRTIKTYRSQIRITDFNEASEEASYLYHESRFDEKGHAVSHTRYDANGMMEERVEYVYNEKGEMMMETLFHDETEFTEQRKIRRNENGVVVEEQLYYMDGSVSKTTFELDDHGLHLVRTMTDEEGTEEENETFAHDVQQRLIAAVKKDPQGNIISGREMKYNADGKVIEQRDFQTEDHYDVTNHYTYDESGKTLSMIQKNGKGDLLSSIHNTYDEKGLLLKRVIKDQNNGMSLHVAQYAYDENGNMQEEEITNASGQTLRKTLFEYNEEGNNSSMLTYAADASESSRERMEYEYFD
jgi:hypothetical protein